MVNKYKKKKKKKIIIIYPSIFSLTPHNFKKKESLVYTFDVGMILNGLTNLYRIIKQETYLKESKEIANWLLNLQKKDGSLPAIYNLKENKIADTNETWSTHSGSYHAKISIGLINLYDITKNQDYKNMAIRLCDYALTQQISEGRFISHIEGGTNLHPHCYSAEALLCTGLYLNNKKYINSAIKAVKWILDNEKNNIIPRLYLKEFNYNQRNDILAQTIRLSLILLEMGYLKNYKKKITNLLNKLVEFQHQDGGFFFGLTSDGNKLNHLTSWTTMFALQTLILYNLKLNKKEITRLLI